MIKICINCGRGFFYDPDLEYPHCPHCGYKH